MYTPDDTASVLSELRPSTAGRRANSSNRFTITNIGEDDDDLYDASPQPPTTPSPRAPWLSAEEEKKRLYEEANAKVARVQGTSALQSPPVDLSPVCPI